MSFPWSRSNNKGHRSEVEQSAAKRICVEQPSGGVSTRATSVPELHLEGPALTHTWHRRTMAVTNTDLGAFPPWPTRKPLLPGASFHQISSLSRNTSDIEAEARAGYELAKMTGFRTDMSVKERLFLGLTQAFRETADFDAQIQEDPNRLLFAHRNKTMARGGIDMADRALDFPYALQQEAIVRDVEFKNRTYGLPVTDTTLNPVGGLEHDRHQESRQLSQHFLARSRFVKGAHDRLVAVIRPYNKAHAIPGLVARRRTGQIMNVEWQQGYHGMVMNMSFSAFQGRSMEANGYQRRAIQCIYFREEEAVHQSFPGPLLGTDTVEGYGANPSMEISYKDGRDESISLVELDITDINGGRRRWICIEISKPLVQANGLVPSELIPMPRSYIKIAVPGDKVMAITDKKQPASANESIDPDQFPQLGNFERLKTRGPRRGKDTNQVRLRMCSDGIPIFATGSKRGHIPVASWIDDFLSATNVAGLPWKETDRRVSSANKVIRKYEFWERYRLAAEVDRKRWKSVQDAMARNDCIVDITFKGDWDVFGPSVQAPRSTSTPTIPPKTELPPFAPLFRPQGVKKGQLGRREGTESRHTRCSGLRNEVQL